MHTLEQCELLGEEDKVQRGLTFLLDDVAEENVFTILVDGI